MEYLIAVLVLVLAVPCGYLLRHFTKEEIKPGKKYFKVIWIGSLLLAVVAFLINLELAAKNTLVFGLLFISIVSYISWR